MIEPTGKLSVSFSQATTLVICVVMGGGILLTQRDDYPVLHTMLDTSMFLLPGVLGLLFRDMDARINHPFLKLLAVTFALTSLMEFIHVLTGVEWPATFDSINRASHFLRPMTWPPPAHLLPIGIACSVLLRRRKSSRVVWLEIALLFLTVGLFAAFAWLPRYTVPVFLGITRPTLILVPLLWVLVGLMCWQWSRMERLLPTFLLSAAVFFTGNSFMLYSRAPHDSLAMIAHLGTVAGHLILLLAVMQLASVDMLERIRAERELANLNRELEERVIERTAVLQEQADLLAHAHVLAWDPATGIKFWNKGAEQLYGFSSDEALGHMSHELLQTEFPKPMAEIEADLFAAGVWQGELVHRKRDGSRVHVASSLTLRRKESTGETTVIEVNNDITDRKHAEIKLQSQLDRLDLLQQITHAIGERQDIKSIFQVVIRRLEDSLAIDFCCICLYDPVTEMLTVTSVGVLSQELALEMSIAENASIAIDENGLSRCVHGQLVYEPNIRGALFPFPQRLVTAGLGSLVIAPLLVESKVFGILVAARCEANSFSSGECEFIKQLSAHVALAAHQSQLYSSLEQAYEDLRQTQETVMHQERLRALGQMASGVAHDINNALSPVVLYTESLLTAEHNLSANGREKLTTIQRAIDDVVETVARMREFYRQREDQLTLLPLKANHLVQQVINLTRARWSDMAQHAGVSIEMIAELAPDTPTFNGVESEIREALTNLVFNAVDSMPDGGTLTMRTGVREDGNSGKGQDRAQYVYLEVSDTGVGMDEATRLRCLEPFFTTKGERGTGLGLAMVYGTAERHSAEVEVKSVVGQGTTVRLCFAVSANVIYEGALDLTPETLPSHMRLLIVDDDPVVLKSLRETLTDDGHQVVVASGGQQGIDAFNAALASHEAFAVVITDLGMPYVDGRKVASAVKLASPETPVILLTGWGQRMVAEGEIPRNVDRVLSKPPKVRELREALASICLPEKT
jgi:PAS domain S-box-containing protein